MTAEDFKKEWRADATLQVGQNVTVFWTNSGRQYSSKAKIDKINKRSVRVKISEPILGFRFEGDITYPAGHEIIVPRITDIGRWSFNNRVVP